MGTRPATQACALTGNQTGELSDRRLALNPLSHTSQGEVLPSLTQATTWRDPEDITLNEIGQPGGSKHGMSPLMRDICSRQTHGDESKWKGDLQGLGGGEASGELFDGC